MSTNKKRNIAEDQNDESDGSDMETDDIYTGNEEIQVDFEGRNPIDSDFDGIKQLLSQLFLNAKINTSELTEIIIGQNYIGSVIMQSAVSEEEDDDDDDEEDSNMIFGITSAINITNRQDKECIKQFRSFIIDKADKYADEATAAQLRDLLGNDSKPTGFLINERFINIPPQISIPMLENLQKEITRANDKKMPYNFSQYLMILKYYKTEATKNKPEQINYSNPEEEIIQKNVIASFDYSVADETDSGLSGNWLEDDVALTPYRKVIVFDGKKLPTLINQIRDFVE